MRGGGDAFAPFVGGDSVGVEFLRVVVCAEAFEDFAFLVEDADAAGELGHGGEVSVEIDGAGLEDAGGVDGEEFTVEVEVDEAVVGAVADEDAGGFVAVVEGELVGGLEIPRLALACDGALEFAVLAEDEDPV